jgi:hypothetical protein
MSIITLVDFLSGSSAREILLVARSLEYYVISRFSSDGFSYGCNKSANVIIPVENCFLSHTVCCMEFNRYVLGALLSGLQTTSMTIDKAVTRCIATTSCVLKRVDVLSVVKAALANQPLFSGWHTSVRSVLTVPDIRVRGHSLTRTKLTNSSWNFGKYWNVSSSHMNERYNNVNLSLKDIITLALTMEVLKHVDLLKCVPFSSVMLLQGCSRECESRHCQGNAYILLPLLSACG